MACWRPLGEQGWLKCDCGLIASPGDAQGLIVGRHQCNAGWPEAPFTQLPGVPARHAVISDTCRTNRGDAGAFAEAVARLRQTYEAAVPNWPIGTKATFHVVLTVDRKGRDSLAVPQTPQGGTCGTANRT